MSFDYVNAQDRLAGLEDRLCMYVDIPVPPGTFEDTQRVFTGVLYDLARYYRAHVDEVRRVSGAESVDAENNRVLFFRAHRRSGWYVGKDGKGRPGFFKIVYHDKNHPRKSAVGPSGEHDPVASGIVDQDDHIRWKRTDDQGEERYLDVRVMKCLEVKIGPRANFSGLCIVEDFSTGLREKLQRVAQSIKQLRPEVAIEIVYRQR